MSLRVIKLSGLHQRLSQWVAALQTLKIKPHPTDAQTDVQNVRVDRCIGL